MKKVTVRIETVLDHLKTNLSKHSEIFEKAWDGYRRKVIEVMESNLIAARKNGPIRQMISLDVPEDHSEDYRLSILMLEMAQDAEQTEIEISSDEFRHFVLDDWSWKDRWNQTTVGYASGSQ